MTRRELDDGTNGAKCSMNMTPMIDVVFQLIVVFLCSMKFRTLDQKLESHLSTVDGIVNKPVRFVDVHPTLSVRLVRKGPEDETRLFVSGTRLGEVREGEALWTRLTANVASVLRGSPDLVGEIDASPAVDHGDVVRTLDGFVAAGLTNVRFRGTTIRK